MSIAITIDGPAAAGKTTAAKILAKRLPTFLYVDTGAFYRAVAFVLDEQKFTCETLPEDLSEMLTNMCISADAEHGRQDMFINGYFIPDAALRTERISQLASAVSAKPEVRQFVNQAIKAYAAKNNVIMEGRDTGTAVMPNADVKIYLTADLQERVNRRLADDIQNMNTGITFKDVEQAMVERDYRDTHRLCDPLRCPEGALFLNNTHLNIEECANTLLSYIRTKLGIFAQ